MNPDDFDSVGKFVCRNVDQINHHLGKAKLDSKFLSNKDAGAEDLPAALLALAKEQELEQTSETKENDPMERPSEEEIDALFEVIRSRPTANSSNKCQRQGSFKKTAAAVTAAIANKTTASFGSSSDLTLLINKSSVPPVKQPPVDVDAMVAKLRQSIDLLGTVENGEIEAVDLAAVRQQFRREWAGIGKACRNVEALLEEFKQQTEGNGGAAGVKKEPIISNELVKSMKQLQIKLHYAVSLKKAEILPDITKTLNKEVLPLSPYIDMIDETIRQMQL
uniref:Uncharacterized protein n=1 Tax=Anopheles epiroticus TaxID=199890 RepID=A0A182PLZ5_9DIPT